MSQSPTTRLSLVLRLRDAEDREAWRQFVELYAPLVYRYCRQRGLQDADAADLTQEVLQVVANRAKSFSHNGARGAFRRWLYTVARNRLGHFFARRRRGEGGAGDTAAIQLLEAIPAPDEEATLWEQEYQQCIFAWASQQIRGHVDGSTWQAFWQTAVEGKSGGEVAAALGMSRGAVYMAKSRIMARLRKLIDDLEELEG
jgi:RNA polymerase sigma-70 factor (ECF subfamily)